MKVLVQRVKSASVSIEKETVGEISNGYLLFVCFEENDTLEAVELAVEKISKLRIFEDQDAKMNKSIMDINGEILSVSQFTLSWDGKKGHRPSFDKSLNPNDAKIYYRKFNDGLSSLGLKIEKGIFGAEMLVSSINDGPVTFMLEF
jgi:D-tyrosyl-tRNA(Tyr) deacylase